MLSRRSCLAGLVGLGAAPATARAAESKYRGATVRFLTERNAHQLALADKLAEIARAWGVDFAVRYITTDEIEKMVVIDYVGGAPTWDLVYTGGVQRMAQWAYGGMIKDIAPLIASVGDKDLLAWDDFTEAARHAVTDGDKRYGLTVATSEQAVVYRKDLFSHPEEQRAFQAKYGYQLQAPSTYAQAVDVTAFFTRKSGQTLAGKPLTADFYGTILADKRGTFLWHTYENFVAAYGVNLFDPQTHKVGLTSPANIAAVTAMKSFVPYLPASHINMGSGEIANMFAAGQAAFIGEYFDRLLLNLSNDKSPVTLDMVDFTLFPTAEGAADGAKHGARSGPPVVSIYGRSRNAEAAYKLLEAAVAPEQQLAMADKNVAYMPSRVSALRSLAAKRPVTGYLLKLAESGAALRTDRDILPYPSIMKAAEIVDAVTGSLSEIMIGGEVEPKLLEAQAKMEKLLGNT
jgi:multiple sugar transport system substrate-binding protein